MSRLFALSCMLWALLYAGTTQAVAPFADAAYDPPAPKTANEALTEPIDPAVLDGYLAQMDRFHVYDLFAGQTDALKAMYPPEKGRPLKGGEEVPLDLDAESFFGTPIRDADRWIFLGSIQSLDAEGIRLQVDLSTLDPDSEVWIVDPVIPRAYGPYKAADYPGDAFWLATVFHDESVLMVRSPQNELPNLRVAAYSHLFLSLKAVALSCNISVACSNSDVRTAASGTAILAIGGTGFCSGTLINNPKTTANEPFLITANHCICSRSDARNTEAYWDFRESSCGALDAGGYSSHPRSNGTKLLASNSCLDATLIQLDNVPGGSYGRVYAGWDTRTPVVNEYVRCIHYPRGTYNRASYGRIQIVDNGGDSFGYQHQNKVVWDEGVTEGGSSGSCLLFNDNMRLLGTLSNGTSHTCGADRSNNIDYFSSFRHFYEDIKQYIDSATPSTAEGSNACDSCGGGLCPAKALLENYPKLLENLRAFRDKVLLHYAATAPFVKAYYAASPIMLEAVRHSTEARGLFLAVALPVANLAGEIL